MLLDHSVATVVLQVEQVLNILHHLCPLGFELPVGEVTSSLQTLTPLGLPLILDRKQGDGGVGRVSEALLTHHSERHMCYLLDSVIQVASNDRPGPWCHRVDGYLHLNLTTCQAVRLKWSATVDRD
jgi:hypothetical protein